MEKFHKIKHLISVLMLTWIISCDNNNPVAPAGSLSAYIENRGLPVSNQLIACASGSREVLLDDPDRPVSIFFLPIEGAKNFQYFETENDFFNPDNFDNYSLQSLPLDSVFNGYLMRFLRLNPEERKWGKVVYETEDSLHICNAIALKYPFLPTEYGPQLLSIDQSESLSPNFEWTTGSIDDNAIYFQVVSDAENNLLSGTYTFDTHFQFYQLDNVVINIRDVNPAPQLVQGNRYTFTLMGVSLDNWVNLVADTTFVVE